MEDASGLSEYYKEFKESMFGAANMLNNFPSIEILDELSSLQSKHKDNQEVMAILHTKQSTLTEKIIVLSSRVKL